MSEIKVLVFDIDMTICDNFDRNKRAFERTIGHNIPEKKWSKIRYKFGFDEILQGLEINLGIERIVEDIMQHFLYDEDLFQLDRPFERAVEILNRLDKVYTIYYLTGRPIHHTATDFLHKFCFPEGKVFSQKVGLGESYKKSGLFRQILDEAKVSPRETVSIADLPGDAFAAKDIGVITIGTNESHMDTKEELLSACNYVIENIMELPEVLERME